MARNVIPLRRPSSELTTLSDVALLSSCAAGDADALGQLFERHHRAVYRYLGRMCADRTDIDDLVQATFLEAWRAATSFRERSSVCTWLFGIAHNIFRHHVRADHRRSAAISRLAERPAALHSAEPAVASKETVLLERLAAALADLPVDLRSAYVLCDIEDVAQDEAARTLGVRANTFRSRLHQARKRLAAALEEAQ